MNWEGWWSRACRWSTASRGRSPVRSCGSRAARRELLRPPSGVRPTATTTATPADCGGLRRAAAPKAPRSQTPTNGSELRKQSLKTGATSSPSRLASRPLPYPRPYALVCPASGTPGSDGACVVAGVSSHASQRHSEPSSWTGAQPNQIVVPKARRFQGLGGAPGSGRERCLPDPPRHPIRRSAVQALQPNVTGRRSHRRVPKLQAKWSPLPPSREE
jgi:hypothetical protein